MAAREVLLVTPGLTAHSHTPTPALHSTCPALVALFAHVGIMSKKDSHRLQVPQGHSQLQRGPPSGILLFNVVLREMGHSTQGKREPKQGGHRVETG